MEEEERQEGEKEAVRDWKSFLFFLFFFRIAAFVVSINNLRRKLERRSGLYTDKFELNVGKVLYTRGQ